VHAVAKAEVVVDAAADVEAVAVGEAAVVAIGRAVEHEDGAAGGDHLAVELHVGGDVAGLYGRGGLEAKDLLDGLRHQAAVLDQLAALIGVVGEDLAGPADQAGGGLVAGGGDEVDVVEDLVPREAPGLARLVLELGLEQLGHQVVGGVLGPPVQVVGEELRLLAALEHLGVDVGHLAVVEPQPLVDAVPQGLLVGLGDAEEHADGAHRHLRPQVPDEVEATRAHQRIEGVRGELAHLALDGVHPPGREHAGQDAAVPVVTRRILEDEGPRRHLEVGLDQLEQRALRRAERLPVLEPGLHVVEPAERPEVVPLVPVQRRLLPQAAPDRVGVGVDVEVVRVVVQLAGLLGGGHRLPLGAAPHHGSAGLQVRLSPVNNLVLTAPEGDTPG
jgi:hypothetical protein